MKQLIITSVSLLLLNFVLNLLNAGATRSNEPSSKSTIVFATLGRSNFAFDIFALPPLEQSPTLVNEIQLTDGKSVNFNGYFVSSSDQTVIKENGEEDPPKIDLIYVTERNGTPNIYYDAVYYDTPQNTRSRSVLEKDKNNPNARVQVQLLDNTNDGKNVISMKDKPSLVNGNLIYVSTHENPGVPRVSWTAVYSTELTSGLTHRLTPYGVSDFSPAVSPSGTWTAVASYGERNWSGEVEELSTDIYIFLTRDGTHRVKVVDHGGWPSWVDDSTLYFHRRGLNDKWISVYRAILRRHGPVSIDSVVVERVTPPGLHAFTPATSPGNNEFIAVATRRPDSVYRHIEIFDVVKEELRELTRLVSPETHHFNPFISPDSIRVGYHKCRGEVGPNSPQLLFENVKSPAADLSLFRIDGAYPSFSPTGDRIAYVEFPGLTVVNRDGSNKRQVYANMAFSTAWNPVYDGLVYTSAGPKFAPESTQVDLISIDIDEPNPSKRVKRLTTNNKNNGFPSVSPDGERVVFRSSRSGHKNLYIMDAFGGEQAGLFRLTEGEWTDTMCNWSPDGEWIAFASDRETPGSGSFEIFIIHPNGTGLRKVVQSGLAGRTNHPWFSPDGKSLVFTSDYAGISSEPISTPVYLGPYGDIFTVMLDGSGLKRLTHNSHQDGTPTWAPIYMKPFDVEWPKVGPMCNFVEEGRWLNKVPNHGAPFGSSQAQCGHFNH